MIQTDPFAIWPSTVKIKANALLLIDEIGRCQELLLPEESGLALGATKARMRELSSGRAAVRHAMQVLGRHCGPLLSDTMGAPVWPEGTCGSLSHTTRHIAALVALTDQFDSVGVDIDDGRELGGAVSDVATLEELKLAGPFAQSNGTLAECIVFSAKEAVFKCQCPITSDQVLGFRDIRLVQGDTSGTLKFVVDVDDHALLIDLATRITIHIHLVNGVTVATAMLPML